MNICSYEINIIIKMRQILRVFKALSDPTRLRILVLLLQGELCVCELSATLEMEQSRISHQLRVLRNADLVEDTRDGKWIIYRVSENKKKDLNLIFDRLIGESLAGWEEISSDRKKLLVAKEYSIRNCPVSIERSDA